MKHVLILGATSAIAQETAKLFAARGDQLFLAGRNEARLKSTADDLAIRGGREIGTMVLDLNDTTRHASLIKSAENFLGCLDIVLITQGTLGDQRVGERDWKETERQLQTNFIGPVSLLTLIALKLEARGQGTLAVISSVAGDRGRQSNYIYGAAKGGLSLFLQGLRNRLYPSGVHVLTIKPGFVKTPMTAHLKQGPLFVEPGAVARGILRAIETKKDVVYLPGWWRLVMWVIRIIPERIFKRLRL